MPDSEREVLPCQPLLLPTNRPPESFLTEAMRQQAIGLESAPAAMEIEKGAILRFAEAIGDPNPQWNDEAAARKTGYGGLTAPPTFLRSLRGVQVELPFDLSFTRRLDAGSDWEYFQPVRPRRPYHRRGPHRRPVRTQRTVGVDGFYDRRHYLYQPVR